MTLRELQTLKRAWEAVRQDPPKLVHSGATLREAPPSIGPWIHDSQSSIFVRRIPEAIRRNKARARFVIVCFVLMPKILHVLSLHIAHQALAQELLKREVDS